MLPKITANDDDDDAGASDDGANSAGADGARAAFLKMI